MAIPTTNRRHGQPRLLILEPDEEAASALMSLFSRSSWRIVRDSSSLQRQPPFEVCCIAIHSLTQLHRHDLSQFDAAICASVLRDGSGLDAIAYMQGMRPELPVIVLGSDDALALEAIRCGAQDFILMANPPGPGELHMLPLAVEKCLVHQRMKQENQRLHRDLRRSIAELAMTNQQLQTVIRQLETMARTDELTGLYNRRWFNLALHGNWAEATRHDLPLACLMIDLDSFKSVNDTLGHHQGDDLLRLAAKVIRANCREVDIPARYGGDEFCILMSHTQAHEAAMVAQRILNEFKLATRNRPADEPPVGMSIGISHINLSRPINAEQFVSHADEAMYAAKSAGKQRVMIRAADGTAACVRVA